MSHTLLPDRAVLAVWGGDARAFLQGLITGDIRKVTPSQAIFAALLSPQGKFLHDFFILEQDGKLLLETDKPRLPELKKRLAMYRLRSKVEMEELQGWQVAAAWGEDRGRGPGAGGQAVFDDPRLAELGVRIIYGASSRDLIAGSQATGDYDQHRLSLAVPEGSRDLTPDRSLILEYGYDALNAVDFNKGCYVGQEVTARSKHRATLRKFIHAVQADSPLPPFGTVVTAGEKEAGVMLSSSGNAGLAHCRVEEVERARGSLACGGLQLRAKLPAWCRTSFAPEIK